MSDTPHFDEASVLDEARRRTGLDDSADLELTEEAEKRMREWAVENARDKRPVHHYTLEKFGFSEVGLSRDFARYRARFIASGD